MLDLNLVRQNAELKSKDNSYTWIAPDRVIAMIDEIERLRKLIAWCKPRLKETAYRTLLDHYLDNPHVASEWDNMKIVQSDGAGQSAGD